MKNDKRKKYKRGLCTIISCVLFFIITITITLSCYRIEYYNQAPVFASTQEFDEQNCSVLNIKNKQQVKVMYINDLHLSIYMSILNQVAYSKLEITLQNEKPDLVVLTGDIVFSFFNKVLLRQLANFFEERQIYFCYAFGNHDTQVGASQSQLASVLKDYKYSLFQYGYNLGNIGNYFVLLKNSDEETVFSLCMLNPTENGVINQKQVDWYEWTINGINESESKTVPNILNMHHPIKQVAELIEEKNYTGRVKESASILKKQANLYEKIVELDTTKWIFNAHDHLNDFVGFKDGIAFRNCRSSGYSSYSGFMPDFKPGVTIANINIDDGIVTSETIIY